MTDADNTTLIPTSLMDVILRLASGAKVYGFELELLADFVSRQ